MKKVFIFLFVIVSCSNISLSQELTSKSSFDDNSYYISAGIQISAKGGVNTTTIEGLQNGFSFNGMPDIGLTTYLPFTKESYLGFQFDMGYSTYSYQVVFSDKKDLKNHYYLNYFTFSPYFCLMGFNIGINYGIPLGGSIDGNLNPSLKDSERTLNSNDMNYLLELKLGGTIPIFKNHLGRLNILVNFGYVLSELNENAYYLNESSFLAIKPASASIGISYLFNILEL